MATYKVYHNPRCSKSRNAVNHLQEQNADMEIVEYLKEVPSEAQLKEVLSLLGMRPEELLRKNEADFKENFKGKSLTDDEWIAAMVKFPKLIERPIVIKGNKAIVARPLERINELD